jgi:hypothetical protein
MLLHDFVSQAAAARFGTKHGADKEFAVAVHDALSVQENLKFDTVKTRISKFLNGHAGGRDFFFDADQPHRLPVLAEVLGADADTLRNLNDQFVFIIDPRLDSKIVEFLQHRTEHANKPFACIVLEPAQDPRPAMRDEAKKHQNAKVVIGTPSDDAYFDGAGVAKTQLRQVPLGWLIHGHDDLFPLPPPPPPVLFDNDGAVRFPVANHPRLAELWDILSYRDEKIRMDLHNGLSPTIDLQTAVEWFKSRGRSKNWSDDIVTCAPPRAKSFPTAGDETRIWQWNRIVYADGPCAAKFKEFMAPHHDVQDPPWTGPLAAFAQQLADPWQAADDLTNLQHSKTLELLDAIRAAGPWVNDDHYGRTVEVDGWKFVAEWIGHHIKAAQDSIVSETAFKSSYQPFADATAKTTSEIERVSGLLRLPTESDRAAALALIEGLLTHGTEPTTFGHIILRVLDRSRSSALAILDRGPTQAPHLAFDLGGGHLIDLRSAPLLGAPRPLKPLTPAQHLYLSLSRPVLLWGGDVLVRISATESSVLEGAETPRFAMRREREAEARARADDD